MKALKFLPVAAAAAIAFAPQFAAAESNVVTTTTGSATARLKFEVVIPRVLYLQVGTGTPVTTDTTQDQIVFSPTATQIVNNTANLAGTGGDLTGGAVTVRVFANSGNVTLSAAGSNAAGNTSGMQLGAATTYIPWTEIVATAAAGTTGSGFTAATINHPTIGTGSVTLTAAGGVVRQAGKWTFAYANSGTYAPGTYDGTVTYTASAP
jgi:hypothetical protein